MHESKQKLVRALLNGVIALGLLVLLLLTTNPYHLPIIALLLPFLLVFVITYEAVFLIFSRSPIRGHKHKQRLNAVVVAGGLVGLALLQSIRELSLRDLIIIVVLVLGLSFYLLRIDF
jgi:hypothetical protein